MARELVDFRKQNGPFRNREQLLQVPGVGPARYVQAAGFLPARRSITVMGGKREQLSFELKPEVTAPAATAPSDHGM